MEPKRLIIFLELVDGCNNKKCPSWGKVCIPRDQKLMSLDTLNSVTNQILDVLNGKHPFEKIDIWLYGNGDSLDHPNFYEMSQFVWSAFKDISRISMAIDSRRDHNTKEVLNVDWNYFHKIKLIHKQPESFDWLERAKLWRSTVYPEIPMSHKLITNSITKSYWDIWKSESFITELKAVPWHDIVLGTDDPQFTQREKFTYSENVKSVINYGPYPGLPVRRSLIKWNGNVRRCLVSPTQYRNIKDLLLMPDDICPTCWPKTGSELCKFYEDRIVITPSANCVSDGYFMPTWE